MTSAAPVVELQRGALRAATLRLDPARTPALFDLADEARFAWRSGRHELVAAGVAARVVLGSGPGRLGQAAAATRATLATIAIAGEGPGPVAAGALPFGPAAPGELIVPELVLRRRPDGDLWATLVGEPGANLEDRLTAWLERAAGRPGDATPVVTAVKPVQDRAWWDPAVRRILAAIEAGELAKAVLARELIVEADRPFEPAAVLRAMARRVGQSSLLYAVDGFVGASPELLVRRMGKRAWSCPLAGTVPRGATPAEEARLLAGLAASVKEAAEHQFVVDAVAEGLGRVAGRLEVRPRETMPLATVIHLATMVEAELPDPAPTALELAAVLHPTPAVAGTPPDAALDLLAELEPFDRGPYAGPVGWVDASGDGEWAIALRGAELDGPRARLLGGAGIVTGSDPAAEWAETEAKLGAMLGVLEG
jgi:menaquinone-specific isochorismate synthase